MDDEEAAPRDDQEHRAGDEQAPDGFEDELHPGGPEGFAEDGVAAERVALFLAGLAAEGADDADAAERLGDAGVDVLAVLLGRAVDGADFLQPEEGN